MAILVVTNKFQMAMLDDSLGKARGLAMSMPEKQDVENLIKEFGTRAFYETHYCFCPYCGHYETDHRRKYFMEALYEVGCKYWEKEFSSHAFEEGDHILVINTDSYDPEFSEGTWSDHVAYYLISF